MTDYLLGIITGIALCGINLLVHYARTILESINTANKTKNPSGVTYGAYRQINENKESAAIVNPKTPQQIEFEAQEQLRQESLSGPLTQRKR